MASRYACAATPSCFACTPCQCMPPHSSPTPAHPSTAQPFHLTKKQHQHCPQTCLSIMLVADCACNSHFDSRGVPHGIWICLPLVSLHTLLLFLHALLLEQFLVLHSLCCHRHLQPALWRLVRITAACAAADPACGAVFASLLACVADMGIVG